MASTIMAMIRPYSTAVAPRWAPGSADSRDRMPTILLITQYASSPEYLICNGDAVNNL